MRATALLLLLCGCADLSGLNDYEVNTAPGSGGGSGVDYAAIVMADGPVGYWRLGEGQGPTAFDETGNNDGVYEGDFGWTAGALQSDPNEAAIFKNTGVTMSATRVELPSTVHNYAGNDPFSVELWLSDDMNMAADATIIAKVDRVSANGWGLVVLGGSRDISFQRRNPSALSTVEETIFTASAFTHIVATFDGSDVSLYFNGALRRTQPSFAALSVTTAKLYIGATDDSNDHISGVIDEVAIYDRELDLAAIERHYAAGAE